MPAKGWRTVSLRTERLEELDRLYQQDRKRPRLQEFGNWLDNILLLHIEFQEKLKEYGPFIEFKDVGENMVYLYDHRIKQSVDVYINGKKKELQCDADKTNNCVHVGFCFAVPEVYNTLIEAGFKQPK